MKFKMLGIVAVLLVLDLGLAAGATENSKYSWTDGDVHLAVVACGDRFDETMVMIKSALIFTRRHLHLHVFADDDLRPKFKTELENYPEHIKEKFVFDVYPITYPEGENAEEWKKMFKTCATQRLFIPSIIDSAKVPGVLYVDTDVLFMRPPEDVWSHFNKFNSTHVAALAPEHESPEAGWYNRFARHPYYGKLGVNSGVMLMDVNGLEASNWVKDMIKFYWTYKYNMTWGDQDLINVYFHFHPDQLYVYPCHWNYRADHCMYMSVCKEAETRGAYVVHGIRRYFHNDKQPLFKAVYETFRDFPVDGSIEHELLPTLKQNLADSPASSCKAVSHIFWRGIESYLRRVKKEEEKQKSSAESANTKREL